MFILGITFKEFIQKPNVIVGIVLAILGIASWLLAKSVAQTVRKTSQVATNDSILLGCKIAGLIGLLFGMVVLALPL